MSSSGLFLVEMMITSHEHEMFYAQKNSKAGKMKYEVANSSDWLLHCMGFNCDTKQIFVWRMSSCVGTECL